MGIAEFSYFGDFLYIAVFAMVGALFLGIILTLQKLLAPSKPENTKLLPYECGNDPVGDAWVQFPIRYYYFIIIFVVFDVETVFLFPWAVVFQRIGLAAFIEMAIFVLLLLVGFIYAWKKGALEWV